MRQNNFHKRVVSTVCRNCNSRSIKTKRNYHHGASSRPMVSRVCRACGSHDINTHEDDNKRRFR